MKNPLLQSILDKVRKIPVRIWGIIILSFFIGYIMRSPGNEVKVKIADIQAETHTEWTCSMHPQVRLPEKGQCPICFMDLIPLESSTNEGLAPNQLELSPNAEKLAEITTEKIKRGIAEAEIRLSGKIDYDETQIKTITAWVPGRLERLYVDYTGVQIQKDDHLVEIYSPNLYSAQEELIQSWKYSKEATGLARESALITLAAAREKLARLGLSEGQIRNIEEKNIPSAILTILSPMSGIVIHKKAVEGIYVDTGSPIYTIANLDRVWVLLDAYESDLPFLSFGQNVEFTVEALPGISFKGRISFIDPILDDKNRTVSVRLNIDNKDGHLKPGMFVKAIVNSVIDQEGKTINSELAGKWVGPMHPEIIKEEPGICDICGMDLVRAEDLGIINKSNSDGDPLLVSASAVLKTGKRAIVYVKIPNKEKPTFEGREVVLGPRVGDNYVIIAGLIEGEEVVTNGNFKIDSAMQIAAKPSMMNPEGGVSSTGHENHGGGIKPASRSAIPKKLKSSMEYHKTIEDIYANYFAAQTALANDDLVSSKNALNTFKLTAGAINDDLLKLHDASLKYWQDAKHNLIKATEHAEHWSNIKDARKAFEIISVTLLDLERSFGHANDMYYEIFCPMANDNQGASWIQTDKKVNNPYFGAKMQRCGEVRSELMPATMEHNNHE